MATSALSTRAPLVASRGDTRVPRRVVSARAFPSRSVGSNARATIRSIRERGRGGLTATRGPAPAAATSAPAEETAPLAESVREKRRVCLRRALALLARLRNEEPLPPPHRRISPSSATTSWWSPPTATPPDEYAGAKVIGVHGFKLPSTPATPFSCRTPRTLASRGSSRIPATRPDVLLLLPRRAHLDRVRSERQVQGPSCAVLSHSHPSLHPPIHLGGSREAHVGLHPILDRQVRPHHGHLVHPPGRAPRRGMPSPAGVAEGGRHRRLQPDIQIRGDARQTVRRPSRQGDWMRRSPRRREEPQGAQDHPRGCPEGTNLALIGDGPERAALEEHFEGTNTTFTGMLLGDDLAAAYASLDVFVMPSESETLGPRRHGGDGVRRPRRRRARGRSAGHSHQHPRGWPAVGGRTITPRRRVSRPNS